jgi:hypothetical protein
MVILMDTDFFTAETRKTRGKGIQKSGVRIQNLCGKIPSGLRFPPSALAGKFLPLDLLEQSLVPSLDVTAAEFQ